MVNQNRKAKIKMGKNQNRKMLTPLILQAMKPSPAGTATKKDTHRSNAGLESGKTNQ